ncbi:TPA: phage virion morphogenesis protein [Klebsiella aerogenes]|nr:phage virion morphogenesis protein [Klebsiella aerogenes]HDU6218456.1 phage virion morphogenesis protein [Klebsiella aerogenes]
MFAKLRTTKYLKTEATTDSASMEFAGQMQRIARVYHYGLREKLIILARVLPTLSEIYLD